MGQVWSRFQSLYPSTPYPVQVVWRLVDTFKWILYPLDSMLKAGGEAILAFFFIRSNSNPMSVVVAVKGNKCLCYRPDSNRKENTGIQTILLCREEPTRFCSSFVSFVWFFFQKYISRIPHLSSTLVNFPFFSFYCWWYCHVKIEKRETNFFEKSVRPPASHHLTDHKYRPKPIEFCFTRKFGMFHLSFRGVTSPTPPPPPLSSSYTRSYTFLHFVIHIYSFISFSISYLFIYSLASATSFWTST